MGMVEAIREILRREYGINSDEELLAAIEKEPLLDIGIFVTEQRKEQRGVKAAC